MGTVVIHNGGSKPIDGTNVFYKAVEKVVDLFALGTDASIVPSKGSHKSQPDIAFTLYGNKRDFDDSCCLLRNSSKIYGLSSKKDAPDPWEEETRADIKNDFNKRCEIISLNILDIIGKIKAVKPELKQEVNDGHSFNRMVVAKHLYKHIKTFSHDAKDDITNAYLAPARMLLIDTERTPPDAFSLLNCERLRDVFIEFDEMVSNINKPHLMSFEMVRDICEAWGIVRIPCRYKKNKTAYVYAIEILMKLLTDCRVLAGGDAASLNSRKDTKKDDVTDIKNPAPVFINEGKYRILVVDDHGGAWRPVFEDIAEKLSKKGNPTTFEFSTDGEFVFCMKEHEPNTMEEVALSKYLADYDAVLLDIHLPKLNGLDLLKEIRNRQQSLPVIIWTSSVAHELAAQAALSNGYIYKKKSCTEEIAQVLDGWLEAGRSKRLISLPNPFFDNVLKSEDIRKCAFEFTQWCMKFYDGFHALDQSYYRFFNDHGGRHILSVLGYLEKLIRPFLYENSKVSKNPENALFSENPEQRQKEVLWLYLGALCHEIGMFPFAIHDKGEFIGFEDFETKSVQELKDDRKYHSVRSMVYIAYHEHQYPDFKNVIKSLKKCDGDNNLDDENTCTIGMIAVALIAGYHGRTLIFGKKLNGEYKDRFCTINQDGRDDNKKTTKLRKYNNGITYEEVEKFLNESSQKIDPELIKIIARLCALMRFGDALEIDKTRIPAAYLSLHDERNLLDDWENLRRFVVDEVVIDRGMIDVIFRCPKPHELLYIDEKIVPNPLKQLVSSVYGNDDEISAPFAVNPVEWREHLACCCDILQEVGLDLLNNEKIYTDKEMLKAISGIAGLHVIWDILNEYEAISDLKLYNHIYFRNAIYQDDGEIQTYDALNINRNPEYIKIANAENAEITNCSEGFLFEKDEILAMNRAYKNILSKCSGYKQEQAKYQISIIGKGLTKAKKMTIVPVGDTGEQPKFCKIDEYSKIVDEFVVLKHTASVYFKFRNVIGDMRISKYRDKGVLLGSYYGEAMGPQIVDPKTFDVVIMEKAFVNPDMNMASIKRDIKMLFDDVMPLQVVEQISNDKERVEILFREHFKKIQDKCKNLSKYIKEHNIDSRYENLFQKFADDLKGPNSTIRKTWEDLKNSKITLSIIHGDFHPQNLLYIDNILDSGKFVLIDIGGCGPGHIVHDIVLFCFYLKFVLLEDLVQHGKKFKDSQKFTSKLTKQVKNQYLESILKKNKGTSIEDLECEYEIAEKIMFPRMLLSWSKKIKNEQVINYSVEETKSLFPEMFKMKKSRYNIVERQELKADLIHFNTLYGSLTVFDKTEDEEIIRLLDERLKDEELNPEIISKLNKERVLNPEIISKLRHMKYLIDEDVDEMQIIKQRKNAGIEDRNMLDLIVMPTLDCNFACSYCYLTSRKSMMSDDMEAALIKYLEKTIPEFRLVNLLWFGGEPLLAYDRVVSITKHAKQAAEKHGAALMPHITTNGYLLNRKRAKKLLSLGIFDFQITIDGPRETHDKLRVLKNGDPTFNIVFENTVALAEMDKRANIALRVNFNHTNIDAIPELLEMFPKDIRSQLRIVYEPIFGGCGTSAMDNIPRGDMSKAITDHYSAAEDKGYSVIMGSLNVGRLVYCYAERINQMVINYNGDVFKCSVRDFEPHERVGFIDAKGQFIKDDIEWDKWFGLETFDKKCKTCKFLPLCMGGCRSKRLSRIADDSGDCCSLVPTNVSYTLKQVALGGFSELLGKLV